MEASLLPSLELALPLDQNPAAVYLTTLRPSGRRSMQHYLNVIAELIQPGANALSLNWSALRYQHTAAIRSRIQESGYKPATTNTMLAALRRVLREAWQLGQLDSEDYRRAINLRPIKNETLLRGRALANKEIFVLLQVCADDPAISGVRDAALIAVLYGAGLRRSEIPTLDLADYNPTTGALIIRGGKGGKDRISYLGIGGGATQALAAWLERRGAQPGPLFYPVNKGGKILERKLSAQTVFDVLEKRGKAANLDSFSPHDLRRSFISDLLEAGADIATVQKLVGHANIQTTARYDRRGELTKQKAAGLLNVPYTPKKP
jgi:site-specific recombinase XerD